MKCRDHSAPVELIWHRDEERPPPDWSGARQFDDVGEALETVVNGPPQSGHPWIRVGAQVFGPHEVEDLWREHRMR